MPRKAKNTAKTRRGNKEGSIYQRKDGTWCGQVLIGYKPDGKPNRKTFYGKTREIVAEKITNISSDNFRGIPYVEPQNMTIKELVNNWLFNFKKSEVTARTFEWYLNISKTHIIAELGGIPLKKLTTYHIQNLLNTRMNSGLSLRMLKGIRNTLNQALNHACEMNLIAINPMQGTKLPKDERKAEDDTKVFSPELRKQILEAASCELRMKPVIFTLFFTGMRIGELLALTWGNVELNNNQITIDCAITQDPDYDNVGTRNSCETIVAATKTYSGNRKIKIPRVLKEVLQEWKKLQKSKDVELISNDAVVFPTQKGEMYTYGGFRSTYRRFLERNNLPSISIHSFRHNLASMLLEQGVNPRIVQKMLGHKDIETTLGIYSHVLAEVYEGVADTLGNIYEKTVDGSYKPKVSA